MTDRSAEWQRLKDLYAGHSNEALLELAADRDGLTDDAQAVLIREIDQRGLALTAAAEEVSEAKPVADQQIAPGEVELLMFHDMLSASSALDLMDEAHIPFRLRIVRPPADSMAAGQALLFVDVATADEAAAQALLRREMGLFPLQEVPDQPEEADEAMLPLAEVETSAEAHEVLRLLRQAGIEGSIAPPAKEAEEGDWIEVEVRARVYPQALQVMADGFVSEETAEEERPR